MELFISDKGRHQLSKQHLGLRVFNSMTPCGKDLSVRLCLKGSSHEKIIPILYPTSAHLFLLWFKNAIDKVEVGERKEWPIKGNLPIPSPEGPGRSCIFPGVPLIPKTL